MHYTKKMYDLLFAASRDTIGTFARDEKHLSIAASRFVELNLRWPFLTYQD